MGIAHAPGHRPVVQPQIEVGMALEGIHDMIDAHDTRDDHRDDDEIEDLESSWEALSGGVVGQCPS